MIKILVFIIAMCFSKVTLADSMHIECVFGHTKEEVHIDKQSKEFYLNSIDNPLHTFSDGALVRGTKVSKFGEAFIITIFGPSGKVFVKSTSTASIVELNLNKNKYTVLCSKK